MPPPGPVNSTLGHLRSLLQARGQPFDVDVLMQFTAVLLSSCVTAQTLCPPRPAPPPHRPAASPLKCKWRRNFLPLLEQLLHSALSTSCAQARGQPFDVEVLMQFSAFY